MTSVSTIISQLTPNELIRFVMDQRREKFLYNIPQQRLSIMTPYPTFSQSQLDMRRKTEILTYSANRSNSKTNNLNKKELWSSLSKGSGTSLSQDFISRNISIQSVKYLPTPSSSSNVPGPIVILQYDPDIPLYNYLSRNENSFVANNVIDKNIFRMLTRNEIDFLYAKQFSIIPDNIGSNIVELSYQTRKESVGVIIISNNAKNNIMSFNISTPLAIWVAGLVHMPNEDLTDDFSQEFVPLDNSFIQTVKIKSIEMQVFSNTVFIASTMVSQTLIDNLVSLQFNLNSTDRSFYAVQYVGLINVPIINLLIQAGDIYQVSLKIDYEYNTRSAYALRLFESGFFTNITELNINESVNCKLTSSPPPFLPGTFTFNPETANIARFPNKKYIN
jgi:hypothetical protein